MNAQVARDLFEVLPPSDLGYVEGWSKKRDGDAHVLLLRLRAERYLDDFLALCRQQADVVEVVRITEREFSDAPSNAV